METIRPHTQWSPIVTTYHVLTTKASLLSPIVTDIMHFIPQRKSESVHPLPSASHWPIELLKQKKTPQTEEKTASVSWQSSFSDSSLVSRMVAQSCASCCAYLRCGGQSSGCACGSCWWEGTIWDVPWERWGGVGARCRRWSSGRRWCGSRAPVVTTLQHKQHIRRGLSDILTQSTTTLSCLLYSTLQYCWQEGHNAHMDHCSYLGLLISKYATSDF